MRESLTIVVEITSTSPVIGFCSHRNCPIHPEFRLVEAHRRTGKPSRKHSENFEIYGVKGSLVVSDHYHTYWEDEKKGVEVLVDLLCDMFRIDVEKLQIKKSTMWALDWIKRRQVTPLQELVVLEDRKKKKKKKHLLNVEDVEQILTNSRCSAYDVTLLAEVPTDLKIDLTFDPANFKYLKLQYGTWLTMYNLFELCESCQEIEIVDSEFYLLEMEEIIENWLTYEMRSIKDLSFEVSGFARDRLDILEKLIEYITKLYEEEPIEDFKGEVFLIDEGFEFKREDGAVVKVRHDDDTDFVKLSFSRGTESDDT
ncbi:hypothetical protein CAEBREN_01997 [Caenorhabditis brenneri]|uniref:F-box associated domain-containing protein n=1 Tax=Caenorhabditis brenneri TaxID=135651 RepID=G0MR43_CAEBE|nr:hypothetical protein CAEBREN_01997 [Caenorhabditis brenneri]